MPAVTLADLLEQSRPAVGALELVDTRIVRLSSELLSVLDPPYEVMCSIDGTVHRSGDDVAIDLAYEFAAVAGERVPAWRVDFTLRLGLHLREGETMPEREVLSAYAATTAPLMGHPFARELVYDLCGRLGVLPLVLPVMRGAGDLSIYDSVFGSAQS